MDKMQLDEEAEKLYKPSLWSRRIEEKNMTSKDIVSDYFAFVKTGSDSIMSKYRDTLVRIEVNTQTGKEISYIFTPDKNTHNCMYVHIHGGYWIEGSARTSTLFMAETYINNGFYFAAVSYRDTEPKGPLSDLVRTTVHAVNKICEYAVSQNISSVVIAGHSAGGHLATMLLSQSELSSLSREVIKGLIPTSGVFDLNNLLRTSNLLDYPELEVNNSETADKLSPLVQLKRNTDIVLKNLYHILLIVGEEESPAFKSETDLFYKELMTRRENGDLRCDCIIEKQVLQKTDHFNLISSASDVESRTSGAILKFLQTLSEKLK